MYKVFAMWNFDKEEQWLNEMAAQGLSLVNVAPFRYDFEETDMGAYQVRLEMLADLPSNPKSQNYIRFLEETGVEHIGTIFRWVYFRKGTEEAPFDLFSDIESRIAHLNRMLVIPLVLGISNVTSAFSWIERYHRYGYRISELWVIIAILTTALMLLYGFIRIWHKKRQLQKERVLHE